MRLIAVILALIIMLWATLLPVGVKASENVAVTKDLLTLEKVVTDSFFELGYQYVPSPEESFVKSTELLLKEAIEKHNLAAIRVLTAIEQTRPSLYLAHIGKNSYLLAYYPNQNALVFNSHYFVYNPHVVSVILAYGFGKAQASLSSDKLSCIDQALLPYSMAVDLWQSHFWDLGDEGKAKPGDEIEEYFNQLVKLKNEGGLATYVRQVNPFAQACPQ